MKSIFALALIAAGPMLIGLPAHATPISFQEGVSPTGGYTHDAVYIRESQADTNQNGDTDNEIIVGFTDDDTELRGLLEFDITAIPSGSTIDSVSLVLDTGGGLGGSITINTYRYGFDFDEAVSTWNAPAPGDGTAGGTIGSLLSSSTFESTVTADITFGDSPAFRTAVSDALAGDGFVRLLLARSDNSGAGQHRFARFRDEGFGTAARRPELEVNYTIIPEPASVALMGLGALALVLRRRGLTRRG